MDTLEGVIEVIISLDKFDNTENLEDGKFSKALFGYHVTGSEHFNTSNQSHSSIRNLKAGSSLP